MDIPSYVANNQSELASQVTRAGEGSQSIQVLLKCLILTKAFSKLELIIVIFP